MVKLRVSVGGTYTDLSIVNCNDELHPVEFEGPEFKGRAVVRIRDFVGITNDGSEPIHNSEYFKGHNRRFSIQVEGRFKREWDGEQVYFGTDFDRAVQLPQGFDTMFKIAKYIDPVVKTSLSENEKPWILSPLISSINTMAAWRPQDANLPSPPMTPQHATDIAHGMSLSDSGRSWSFLGKLKRGHRNSGASTGSNSSSLYGSLPNSANNSSEHLDAHFKGANTHSHLHSMIEPSPLSASPTSSDFATDEDKDDSEMPLGRWRQHIDEDTTFFMPDKKSMSTAQRRKQFQTEEARKQFVFKPDLVHGFEFFAPYMDFNTGNIKMALSMNILRYLNGQPVRYTCRSLDGNVVFWAVQFEFVE
ncbi:hypothetical protein BGZ54_000556 [Gamsiella multidivaricata]|nr:hypothetical protein BGZ54_000556 [Gamsiella multidivaricata]